MRSDKGTSPLYSHCFDCDADCELEVPQADALDYYAPAMTDVELAGAYDSLKAPHEHRFPAIVAVRPRGDFCIPA